MDTIKATTKDDDAGEQFLTAPDGVSIFVRQWPVENARGRMLLVHGFAEHSGRYRLLAGDLNQAGYAVAALDLRGHGQSGGRRGHVDAFDDYLADCDTAWHWLENQGGAPDWLLGHSLGGLIAVRYWQRRRPRLRGLVLSSPFLGFAIKVPAFKLLAGKLLSSVLPALTMNTNLDAGVLSHDRRVVEQYQADPLVSRVASARWLTEVLVAQQDALEQAPAVELPLLILQAGDDRLAQVADTRRFFERCRSSDKRLEVYPDFYHEVFNEIDRQRPVSDLCAWLQERSA